MSSMNIICLSLFQTQTKFKFNVEIRLDSIS